MLNAGRIIGLLLCFSLSGCACEDRDGAMRSLQSMGFKNITLKPPEILSSCGEHDGANNPFTATNPSGQSVSGVVCCGGPLSIKGCTVRF